MTEQREEVIARYRTMRANLDLTIQGLTDVQMSERTLDGWSVADHLLHLAAWDEIRAREVERISAGHDSAWRLSDEQDDTLNELLHAARFDLTAQQARWEMDAAFRKLMHALESASDRGLDAGRYGSAGLLSRHMDEHAEWIGRWRSERGY